MRNFGLKKVSLGDVVQDPRTKAISPPTVDLGWWIKTALPVTVLVTGSVGLVHLDSPPFDAVSGLVALAAGFWLLWLHRKI